MIYREFVRLNPTMGTSRPTKPLTLRKDELAAFLYRGRRRQSHDGEEIIKCSRHRAGMLKMAVVGFKTCHCVRRTVTDMGLTTFTFYLLGPNMTNLINLLPWRPSVVGEYSDRCFRCNGLPSTSVVCDAQQRRQWLANPVLDIVRSWFTRPSSATTAIYCSL